MFQNKMIKREIRRIYKVVIISKIRNKKNNRFIVNRINDSDPN